MLDRQIILLNSFSHISKEKKIKVNIGCFHHTLEEGRSSVSLVRDYKFCRAAVIDFRITVVSFMYQKNDEICRLLNLSYTKDFPNFLDCSTTLRKFPRRSSGSTFYSTAILFSHLQSGLDFVLRTKHEILCLVTGLTKICISNEKATRGEETSSHSEETM